MKKISLIFPAWNEEDYVETAISKANESLLSFTNDYEIILIDDGSKDKTREIAESLAKKNDKIKIVCHKKNQKLGRTIRTGISSASKDIILYSDIDLPFDFKEIPKMVEFMIETDSDVVSCYRSGRFKKEPKRAFYSFFYNLLIKFLFFINIKDINCPAKLFKKSIFEKVDLKSNGSFIDAELIIKSIKRGYKVSQMKIKYFSREIGESRASDIKIVLKILKEMMLLYKDTIRKL
jgi:glycosyltransferase involved in cell wall biosynthesis